MKTTTCAALATGLALAAAQASAVTLTFDDLAVGTTLASQYPGVTFTANAFVDNTIVASPNAVGWADDTDMTIVSIFGDAGDVKSPSLVSGNLLHAYSAWENEDGDPSFLVSFAAPISAFSVTFAGVDVPSSSTITAFNGSTVLGTIAGTTTGQFTLSFNAASITSVAVTPGEFYDWVGVDNITYTVAAVPEASTYAMMALGLGLIAVKRRKAV